MVLVVLAALIGAGAGWYLNENNSAKAEMPIAIVDKYKIMDMTLEQVKGTDKEQEFVKIALDKTNQVAAELKEQGFVVLEAESVLSAPDFYFVPRKEERKD